MNDGPGRAGTTEQWPRLERGFDGQVEIAKGTARIGLRGVIAERIWTRHHALLAEHGEAEGRFYLAGVIDALTVTAENGNDALVERSRRRPPGDATAGEPNGAKVPPG